MPSLDVTAPQKVSSTFFVLPSFPPLHTAVGAKKNLPLAGEVPPQGAEGGAHRPLLFYKGEPGMNPRIPSLPLTLPPAAAAFLGSFPDR